ncbi:bifunctional peptidase and (3S)-lysyl hydroxylase Jmjd7-like [Anneissia japonica]|uniref:bifunctional peptidase and (3S)-lysyl hydroxylase Jmjd7-like n=1 Tax=Anneissia japonica TaxID=1529436 RepID=UPI00142592B8|nr:bifunctional peptidase and (3S)-lysyl hydroxylase Jmjd7-like [Anneissia japonica]
MDEVISLEECLQTLALEARELYLRDSVPVLDTEPSPLQFYKDFVSSNAPFIIRNCVSHWPALSKWNYKYLKEKLGDQSVSVAVTPNGYADAIHDGFFVMPEERQMKMGDFLDTLSSEPVSKAVFYLQKQNSNLTTELSCLVDDVDEHISWATEALGKLPDAVNFWLGDKRAVTSMHKDHYENLYCVISGEKHFTLLPPTETYFVPYGDFPAAVYKENSEGDFDIIPQPDIGTVPWVTVDPLSPNLKKNPEFAQARPIKCTLRAGDLLYLPSLWFHHVHQSHGCIAVNYWYDMEFDIKYNYFKFTESIGDICRYHHNEKRGRKKKETD